MTTTTTVLKAPPTSRSRRLLKQAVYGAKEKISLKDRLFAKWFEQLVYPQIWEDPLVDMQALALRETDHVMTISSGGCNALSYLIDNPRKITVVDLNHAHIALIRLKVQAALHLTQEEFELFFIQANSSKNVRLYFDKIAPHLDAESRRYWEGGKVLPRIRLFQKGFYKFGLLGKLIGVLHATSRLYGVKLSDILQFDDIDKQGEWFDRHVAKIFDSRLMKKISQSPFALYNLGIPPSQHSALCEGTPKLMAEVLKERARKLATVVPFSQNYFAWQAFGRRYDPSVNSSLPPYLQSEHFEVVRDRVESLDIQHANILTVMQGLPDSSVDAWSLLDAQDWMPAHAIETLWREISRTSRPGARVIFRTAGLKTVLTDEILSRLPVKWVRQDDFSDALHLRDRSAIYGGFHLYTRVN
jgi:S-adenosylmethionine-diacylglycerol 3-amino-3-carboxypropyl transferase